MRINEKKNILTINQGVPVGDDQHSRTAGENGPTLLEDYHLHEKSRTLTASGSPSGPFMPVEEGFTMCRAAAA